MGVRLLSPYENRRSFGVVGPHRDNGFVGRVLPSLIGIIPELSMAVGRNSEANDATHQRRA